VFAPPLQTDGLSLKGRNLAVVASHAGKFLGRTGPSDLLTSCLYELLRNLETFSISLYVLYEYYKNILLQ
jgi:hypothetical protein